MNDQSFTGGAMQLDRALMFGMFGEHTQTSCLYCFCDSAAVELAMSKGSATGVA